MKKRHAFILVIPLLMAAIVSGQQKTVWNGVYAEDQANRGRTEYLANCSPCHGTQLEGLNGVRLSGPDFMERWREFDVGSLYDFISKSMPRRREGSPNRPGSLSDETYTNIISLILRSNGFPSGAQPLNADVMKATQIEGKDGPKPLPNGALVQLVGCFAAGRTGGWRLSQASEPARTSVSKASTPAELAAAQTRELGHLEFRLANIDYVGPTFIPKDHVDQKMQTKGYLVRQPGNERIDVTSLEIASEHCNP